MKKQLLYLIIIVNISHIASANYNLPENYPDSINDGPYILKEGNKLKVKWIENNMSFNDYVSPENFPLIKKRFNLIFDYNDLHKSYSIKPNYNQSYNMIDSICVISDIHGEFQAYIRLLTINGIIDKNLNWHFGKGHLVILGDIFDRGENTTEILWHLFGLEKQAAKEGGMVHVLLGNHEYLVLSRNLSYSNDKYKVVDAIIDDGYPDLFSETSVLGKWLRSKPVIMSINDILFIHGGISEELLHQKLNISQTNQIFSTKILGKDMRSVNANKKLKFLNGEMGPLWYRGYFNDSSFCENKLDSILQFYEKDHLVVGHTTNDCINSFFNNKIFAVDAGLANKQPGEILLFKEGFFYKCDSSGKRVRF